MGFPICAGGRGGVGWGGVGYQHAQVSPIGPWSVVMHSRKCDPTGDNLGVGLTGQRQSRTTGSDKPPDITAPAEPTCSMALACRAGPPIAHLEGSGPSCASSLKGLPAQRERHEQAMLIAPGALYSEARRCATYDLLKFNLENRG